MTVCDATVAYSHRWGNISNIAYENLRKIFRETRNSYNKKHIFELYSSYITLKKKQFRSKIPLCHKTAVFVFPFFQDENFLLFKKGIFCF